MTPRVREILSFYSADIPAISVKLSQVLNHGCMGGTGKLIVADISGGIENGPAASFHGNPDSYDPCFHMELAIESGVSALMAPQGAIELVAREYTGEVPLFMKLNQNVVLSSWQGSYITSTLMSALQLGCVGVALTLPVGSAEFAANAEKLSQLVAKAKKMGLLVYLSVARAGQKNDEKKRESLPLDQAVHATHLACQMGAHIVESPVLDLPIVGLRNWYADRQIPTKDQVSRAENLITAAFSKQRLVLLRLSRYWESEQCLENLTAWTSAGVSGVNMNSHSYTHDKDTVIGEMSKYQEVLLGV